MGDHKTLKVVRRPLFSHWKSAALGRQEIWCQIYGKKILNPVKGYWSRFILWHRHPLENQRTIKIMIIKIPHVQKNVKKQYIFIHGPLFSQLWFCWIQPKFYGARCWRPTFRLRPSSFKEWEYLTYAMINVSAPSRTPGKPLLLSNGHRFIHISNYSHALPPSPQLTSGQHCPRPNAQLNAPPPRTCFP